MTITTVLDVAVATDGPILEWQSRTIQALASVPGVNVSRWMRLSTVRSSVLTRPASGATAVVPEPDVLRTAGDVDGAPVDVILDLTDMGLPQPDGSATEAWHFSYGDARHRDPIRSALVDYVLTPGRSRVSLVAEPGRRVLRDALLNWQRGNELERILLDVSGWPAKEAMRRLDPGSAASDRPASSTWPSPVSDSALAARKRVEALPVPVLELAAVGRRLVRMRDTFTRHDDWNVGLIKAPIEDVIASSASQPITWMPPRRGWFAADPFGLERDGIVHVFFEEYDQRAGRGTIAHVAMDESGLRSEVETVLDAGVHASYPYLVEDEGEVFMLPETSAASQLVLYGSESFPHHWRPVATLLPGFPAVDASVVRWEDRWWLFATSAASGPNHSLFVWHAPRLTGPWTSHAANPVKSDARSSRPGGTPFISEGQLYRPSQDNSRVYGGRVVVNRVDVLTDRTFEESPVAVFGPPPGSPQTDGFHTLSSVGGYTLVDGNRRHVVADVLTRVVRVRATKLARVTRPGARPGAS